MKNRNGNIFIALALLAIFTLNLPLSTSHAQGTTFTYQGQLQNANGPVHGTYNFSFNLFNTNVNGTAIAGPVTVNGVVITNGLFTVPLDFSANVWNGQSNWLQIAVETNGASSFTNLSPRQQLTPVPYAIFANTASNVLGTVLTGQLSGTVPLAQLPSTVITNGEPSVTLSNVTLTGLLTLPPAGATINAGGGSLLYIDGADDLYAGLFAGNAAISASDNTGIGYGALSSNSNGVNNTAIGYLSLANNTNGSFNVASGGRALYSNTSGNNNTAYGRRALEDNTSGSDNTAEGYEALLGNPGGSNNIALGYLAGSGLGNYESSNILIGNAGVGGDNNLIRIGSGQSQTYIAGVINGNGGGLTNLNLSLAQLPAGVVTNGESAVTFNTVTVSSHIVLPSPADTIDSGGSPILSFNVNNGNFFAGAAAGDSVTSGNNDTVVGGNALSADTTGGNNTALGYEAMQNATNDGQIVAIGAQALQNDNAAGQGTASGFGNNTAVGFQALQADTIGYDNTAFGYQALQQNTNGVQNTAVGFKSLLANNDGSNNVAFGSSALRNSITNSANVAIGYAAMQNTVNDDEIVAIGFESLENDNAAQPAPGQVPFGTYSGYGENTAVGYESLQADVNGEANTGIGYLALEDNNNGNYNTAVGDSAMYYNQAGNFNTAVGFSALPNNNDGNDNTAIGYTALNNNNGYDGGNDNTAVGYQTLTISYGSGNIALGSEAGFSHNFGNNNIYIGNQGAANETGQIYIGTPGVQTATYLAGNVYASGAVFSNGVDVVSDRNAKEDFTPLNPQTVLAKVAGLPITEWNYKTTKKIEHVGPMAQDFHAAFGLNGADDKHISVVDEGGVALAAIQGLNEKVDEKDAEIASLKKQNDSLAQRLDELAAEVKALAQNNH